MTDSSESSIEYFKSSSGLTSLISKNTISILRLIDAFRDPVFLVAPTGRVLCFNEAALECFGGPPPWLQVAVDNPEVMVGREYAKVCPLVLDDRELLLVFPRSRRRGGSASLFEQLPPSLERVAKLLLMGLSDKEIVACTGLSHGSIRTYASRIYQRLNVAGRAELLALALSRSEKDHPQS